MPTASRLAVIVVVLSGVLAFACGDDDETTLTVFVAASLSDVFDEIGERFEADYPGVRLRFSFGGSQRLRLQLEQGARADLFASANLEQIARARKAGLTGDATPFATNTLALVVPADNPAGIATLDDLARGNVRLVIAGAGVPAGALTRAVLAELGVAEAVLAGVVSEEESVRRVLSKVELGEAGAGFVYSTDARAAGDAVRRLPLEETGMRNGYLIAITSDAAEPELAAQFVTFLQGEIGQSILAAAGFEMASGGRP